MVSGVNRTDLEALLGEMFDCELMFHGFTNYMRDYELVVYQSVDPRSGKTPRHFRFVFRLCTEIDVRSSVAPNVWARSTDDLLLDTNAVTMESTGYVWGVRCQNLYPGAAIVEVSDRARMWEKHLAVPFHEVQIQGNAHLISLVFADLSVEEVSTGYAPYIVDRQGIAEGYADRSKFPLRPSDE
jgi:hypothetical protein